MSDELKISKEEALEIFKAARESDETINQLAKGTIDDETVAELLSQPGTLPDGRTQMLNLWDNRGSSRYFDLQMRPDLLGSENEGSEVEDWVGHKVTNHALSRGAFRNAWRQYKPPKNGHTRIPVGDPNLQRMLEGDFKNEPVDIEFTINKRYLGDRVARHVRRLKGRVHSTEPKFVVNEADFEMNIVNNQLISIDLVSNKSPETIGECDGDFDGDVGYHVTVLKTHCRKVRGLGQRKRMMLVVHPNWFDHHAGK